MRVLEKRFNKRYPQTNATVKVISPGRINLIGEHTDYSGGYVLPAAVNRHIQMIIGKNGTKTCQVHTVNYNESITIDLAQTAFDHLPNWAKMFHGAFVLSRISEGVDIMFSGNIPVGAGMSSSAAISTALLFGLNRLFGLNYTNFDMARMAQQIEHQFVGVNCGLMDQMACLFGRTNHAILIDCGTFDMKYSEMHLSGYQFVLIDSKVEHQLDESGYNDRHQEFVSSQKRLKELFGDQADFKNVRLDQLEEKARFMTTTQYKRARHIISENQRTQSFFSSVGLGMENAGKLMTASHKSLKNDYEVTVAQTDWLVDQLTQCETIYGARQMGGGFGGCVITLIKDKNIEDVIKPVLSDYKKKFRLNPELIKVKIDRGTRLAE
jgi:galactokinase